MVAAVSVSSPKSTLLKNPINLRDSSSNFVGGSLKGLCLNLKPRQQRRDSINLVVASATTNNASGRFYFNFTGFPFPLGPFLNRSTIRNEVWFIIFICLIFCFFFIHSIDFGYWNCCSLNVLSMI